MPGAAAEDAGAFQVGESPLELETRADSILESMPALPVAMAMRETPKNTTPRESRSRTCVFGP